MLKETIDLDPRLLEFFTEAITERLEYGPGRSRTHWHECWRYISHHACAVSEIERLRAIVDANREGVKDAPIIS